MTTTTVIWCSGTGTISPNSETIDPATISWITNNILIPPFVNPGGSYAFKQVVYPASFAPLLGTTSLPDSVSAGIEYGLDLVLRTTPPIILSGVSQGAVVMDEILRRLQTESGAPAANQLSYVLGADPCRPGGLLAHYRHDLSVVKSIVMDDNLTYFVKKPPNTRYSGHIFLWEYDGISDWPDLGVLSEAAVPNAIAGVVYLHAGLATSEGTSHPISKKPIKILNTTTLPGGGIQATHLIPSFPLPLMYPFPDYLWDIGSLVLKLFVNPSYARIMRVYTDVA
jgi:PE-PPE domain